MAVSTPPEPGELYLGFIFDPTVEGIELDGQTDYDLEALKASLASTVDSRNEEELEGSGEFEWQGLDYYPAKDLKHGHFFWARIIPVWPGMGFRVSEY